MEDFSNIRFPHVFPPFAMFPGPLYFQAERVEKVLPKNKRFPLPHPQPFVVDSRGWLPDEYLLTEEGSKKNIL